MLMLNNTPAAVMNSVIALLPSRGNPSTGSFPDDFAELGKWFRRPGRRGGLGTKQLRGIEN
jgi:hypothetical protein